jgi:hypothetical protein
MPTKQNNSGFGYLPVLIISALVISGTYFGYNWYNNQNSLNQTENKEVEDVLQAATAGGVKDLLSFFLYNYFDAPNLTEFNKGTTGLIITTSDQLDRCIFAPRASKRTIVKYNFQGKPFGATVFQNVKMHIMPRNLVNKEFAVVALNTGSLIGFNENVKVIKSACGSNVYVIEQPSTPITPANFSTLVSGQVAPIGTSQARIEFDGANTGKVYPSEEGTKLDPSVYRTFVQRGMTVKMNQYNENVKARTFNSKAVKCSGDCNNGFTFTINFKPLNEYEKVNEIIFPAPANTKYDVVSACGRDKNEEKPNTWVNEVCAIGMLQK